jgi:hypothetical protein
MGKDHEGKDHEGNDHEGERVVTIRRFGAMSEAVLAQGCLESAGIESYLADSNMGRIEWPVTRGMRLQVKSEDAEEAIAMLEQSALQAEP